VARVLLMTGAVRDDEAPRGGREVTVGHVDRDALLALGAQPVGQQGKIQRTRAASALACLGNVLELVVEHLLGVVQEAADQRALAVIDRARGREAQQVERHRAPSSPPRTPARARSALLKGPPGTRNSRPSYDPPSQPPRRDRRPWSRRAR